MVTQETEILSIELCYYGEEFSSDFHPLYVLHYAFRRPAMQDMFFHDEWFYNPDSTPPSSEFFF